MGGHEHFEDKRTFSGAAAILQQDSTHSHLITFTRSPWNELAGVQEGRPGCFSMIELGEAQMVTFSTLLSESELELSLSQDWI